MGKRRISPGQGRRERSKPVRRVVAAGLGLAVLFATEVSSARSLEELRACALANLPETTFQQKVKLVSEDPSGGKRRLVADLYGMDAQHGRVSLMLSVDQPQDLSGSRYLLIEREQRDDMYVYLPAVGRTRRIMGGMRGQPLWGTDFSYDDIKQLQGVVLDASTELLGVGMSQQRPAHKLRIKPSMESESPYRRIEFELDDQTCLITEARFFDESGLIKRMQSKPADFRQVGQRWVFGHVTMENLRNATRSSIEMAEIVYDEKISRNLFNPKTFHLSR